jgi:hypothetical protein
LAHVVGRRNTLSPTWPVFHFLTELRDRDRYRYRTRRSNVVELAIHRRPGIGAPPPCWVPISAGGFAHSESVLRGYRSGLR